MDARRSGNMFQLDMARVASNVQTRGDSSTCRRDTTKSMQFCLVNIGQTLNINNQRPPIGIRNRMTRCQLVSQYNLPTDETDLDANLLKCSLLKDKCSKRPPLKLISSIVRFFEPDQIKAIQPICHLKIASSNRVRPPLNGVSQNRHNQSQNLLILVCKLQSGG
ncbi:unnamed protein product [Protopolystoma xenopodis]|uniref:Uncharacterized protein n=1 Tax=Protopolystoma xenopodis TaxID=117903 RepID=A0A448WP55_9PLAT|nr:unnamed protein product [Protopolystoma xenopodis]